MLFDLGTLGVFKYLDRVFIIFHHPLEKEGFEFFHQDTRSVRGYIIDCKNGFLTIKYDNGRMGEHKIDDIKEISEC